MQGFPTMTAPTATATRPVEPVRANTPGNTRPRFSTPTTPTQPCSRAARRARHRCSHAPASTTQGRAGVGCRVFLNNRYYDPTLSRFISVDPLASPGNPQSLNPYTYALGNPVTLSDPLGLCVEDDLICSGFLPDDPHDVPGGTASWCHDLDGPCSHRPDGSVAVDTWNVDGRVGYAACVGGACSIGSPFADASQRWDSPTRGQVLKGPQSVHQAWWCATRGPFACGAVLTNSRVAERQAERWRAAGIPEDIVNAMMHAYWFGLNSLAANTLEISDGDLRALGHAHEADWRDSDVDSQRDLRNNDVGIAIGHIARDEQQVIAAVESALREGRLSCLNGATVTTCSAG